MILLSGDRKTGKTSAMLFEAINTALSEQGSVTLYMVENSSQQRFVRNQVIETVKNLNVISRIENTVINFKNGSRIHFFASVAARHIRGMNFDKIYVDEPNDLMEEIIKNYSALHPETVITVAILET